MIRVTEVRRVTIAGQPMKAFDALLVRGDDVQRLGRFVGSDRATTTELASHPHVTRAAAAAMAHPPLKGYAPLGVKLAAAPADWPFGRMDPIQAARHLEQTAALRGQARRSEDRAFTDAHAAMGDALI